MIEVMFIIFKMAISSVLFLGTCYGYGFLGNKIFRFSLPKWTFMAVGISIIVLIGGPLVYLKIADITVLRLIILAGILASLIDIIPNRAVYWSHLKRDNYRNLLLLVLLFILMLPLFLNPLNGFNPTSDKIGYAVHVQRLLDTGQYGPDPFNSRIAESSLGGQNLLMGLLCAGSLPLYQLRILERFVAIVILLFTLWGFARAIGLSAERSNYFVLFFLLLAYMGIGMSEGNTLTGTFSAIPLYIIFLWSIAYIDTKSYFRVAVLHGLLIGGVCALKGTHIPVMGLLSSVILLFCIPLNILAKIKYLIAVALTGIVMLLPWMINLKLSNNTFLYPFLGVGYHGSQFGIYYTPSIVENLHIWKVYYPLAWFVIHKVFPLSLMLISGIILVINDRIKSSERYALPVKNPLFWIWLMVSSSIATVLLPLSTGFIRYAFIAVFLLAFSAVWVLSVCREKVMANSLLKLFLSVCILYFIIFSPEINNGVLKCSGDIRDGLATHGTMVEPISAQASLKAQNVIPAGELIFSRLGATYFLDFKRNPVWHIDIPGASCLPPGLPLAGDEQQLHEYLKEVGVRYVMYSEIDNGGHNMEYFKIRFDSPLLWEKTYSENIVTFDNLIRKLGLVAKIIYHEDNIVIFDLDQKPTNPVELKRDEAQNN